MYVQLYLQYEKYAKLNKEQQERSHFSNRHLFTSLRCKTVHKEVGKSSQLIIL